MEIVGAKNSSQEAVMKRLGKLCNASRVELQIDSNESELYIVIKNGEVWKIETRADNRNRGYLRDVKRTE